jgi:hypothetical protein
MMSQGLGKGVELDFVDPPPVDSAADLFTGSRTEVELTTLIFPSNGRGGPRRIEAKIRK